MAVKHVSVKLPGEKLFANADWNSGHNAEFLTGTTGTDFNIGLVGDTNIFNIPDASDSARGLITTNPQLIYGVKTFNHFPILPSLLPSADYQAVHKQYVDLFLQGLSVKGSCRVATIIPGNLASDFENGDTIDGVVIATDDRILIKNQAAGAENGIYIVQAAGEPVRASDYDESAEVNAGTFTAITEGTTLNNTLWVQTAKDPIINVDPLVFSQLAGIPALVFSTGLTKTGNTITSNISTGVAGGQNIYGGTAASETLKIYSTTHATKGRIYFGTGSIYDDANNNLGLGMIPAVANKLDITQTLATNLSKGINVLHSGIVAGTGYAGYFSKTGASTINVGLYCAASGAAANYGFIMGGTCMAGFGTTTPDCVIQTSANIANTQVGAGTLEAVKISNRSATINTITELLFSNGNEDKVTCAISSQLISAAGNTRGDLIFSTRNLDGDALLTRRIKLDSKGWVSFYAIRSGATQAGAGAAASEIWKTSGHATLPDNVLMMGV